VLIEEWLWVSAGKDFCVFHAADTRSRAELVQPGEEFDGVLSSDDYSAYNATQSRHNKSVWHICGVTLKSD